MFISLSNQLVKRATAGEGAGWMTAVVAPHPRNLALTGDQAIASFLQKNKTIISIKLLKTKFTKAVGICDLQKLFVACRSCL